MSKLKDNDIRTELNKALLEKYCKSKETKIFNELGVLHGRSRIDVAVVNGILHGYEIKSECDNLLRLPTQIRDYNAVFDRVTIVTQRCHLENVKNIIPKWWGITLVTRNKNEINLRQIRLGRKNPNVDPLSLTHFLWKDEAIEVLKTRGLHRGLSGKPRRQLYEKVVETLDVEELRSIVSMVLRSRVNWLNN